jgi:hypothetical protein
MRRDSAAAVDLIQGERGSAIAGWGRLDARRCGGLAVAGENEPQRFIPLDQGCCVFDRGRVFCMLEPGAAGQQQGGARPMASANVAADNTSCCEDSFPTNKSAAGGDGYARRVPCDGKPPKRIITPADYVLIDLEKAEIA